jgi:TRAP-type mannitol/chloroaromatic compound transport system permease large subunit
VTMGLMSLPAMLKQGYDKDFASGLVASYRNPGSNHSTLHCPGASW